LVIPLQLLLLYAVCQPYLQQRVQQREHVLLVVRPLAVRVVPLTNLVAHDKA
jgi:hypothetical protein